MARVEVITGAERRRRWSAEQKRAIVAESSAPGAVVNEVAVAPISALGRSIAGDRSFAPVRAACTGADRAPEMAAVQASDGEPAIELEFAGKVRVRIPGSVPADLAAAVVKALARR